VRRDDADKSSRMRYLCDVDLNDPRLYDVMLNTERLTFDAAVALLIDLVGQPELVTTEAGKQVVTDRELASKVEVALATHAKTRKSRITVEARQGVVTLEGPISVDQAGQVAGRVPGVREVQARVVQDHLVVHVAVAQTMGQGQADLRSAAAHFVGDRYNRHRRLLCAEPWRGQNDDASLVCQRAGGQATVVGFPS
jgi:BON domain